MEKATGIDNEEEKKMDAGKMWMDMRWLREKKMRDERENEEEVVMEEEKMRKKKT